MEGPLSAGKEHQVRERIRIIEKVLGSLPWTRFDPDICGYRITRVGDALELTFFLVVGSTEHYAVRRIDDQTHPVKSRRPGASRPPCQTPAIPGGQLRRSRSGRRPALNGFGGARGKRGRRASAGLNAEHDSEHGRRSEQ